MQWAECNVSEIKVGDDGGYIWITTYTEKLETVNCHQDSKHSPPLGDVALSGNAGLFPLCSILSCYLVTRDQCSDERKDPLYN